MTATDDPVAAMALPVETVVVPVFWTESVVCAVAVTAVDVKMMLESMAAARNLLNIFPSFNRFRLLHSTIKR